MGREPPNQPPNQPPNEPPNEPRAPGEGHLSDTEAVLARITRGITSEQALELRREHEELQRERDPPACITLATPQFALELTVTGESR
ncbi:hypothetical protein JCM1840_007308 [Sporobolomyces johnsonii]